MITIDPEFKALIPPLSQEERHGLVASLISEGCRDPLVVWNDIILDGHNRYEICTLYNLPFNTIGKRFADRDDAKIWIIQNQFSRRNLSAYARSELALKLEPLISAKAKEKEYVRKTTLQNSVKSNLPKYDTTSEISKSAGVSHDTITKVKKIDAVASEEVKEKLRSGETTINKVFSEIKKEEDLTRRREELAQKTVTAAAMPDTITIHHGDFLKDYTKIKKASVDCIITDPPYVKEWLENYEAFAIASEYVLKPGGFLIAYIGHIHMDRIMAQMTPYLDYYWIMCLKHAGHSAAVHSRGVQCAMKPILVFQKAPRVKPKRYFSDIIEGTGREKDAHEWQQGEEEFRQIFEPFTDPGDLVLDPFMGSGTTLAMAKKLNRRAIGFDIDLQNVEIVKGRVCADV